MTASMSWPASPAFSRASWAASVVRSSSEVSRSARRRVTMPVRFWIHSSEELMGPAMSSLVTTRLPRAAPTERMRLPATGA